MASQVKLPVATTRMVWERFLTVQQSLGLGRGTKARLCWVCCLYLTIKELDISLSLKSLLSYSSFDTKNFYKMLQIVQKQLGLIPTETQSTCYVPQLVEAVGAEDAKELAQLAV
ncbi:hypothetical protein HDU91_003428, partial [Kappamyces sp. JEL0680]